MTPHSTIADTGMGNFVLIGDPGNDRQSYWTSTDDPAEAQAMAMVWLVCGFSAKVIDMKLSITGTTGDTPTILIRFINLASVQANVPGLAKFCNKRAPLQLPKWPMTTDEINAYILSVSNGTPDAGL